MVDMITIPKEKFEKVLDDVEILLADIESLTSDNLNTVALKRLKEIKEGTAETISEKEFLEEMKKQGIKIDTV